MECATFGTTEFIATVGFISAYKYAFHLGFESVIRNEISVITSLFKHSFRGHCL